MRHQHAAEAPHRDTAHTHDTPHTHDTAHAHDASAEAELADILDLDGEVLHGYWADALSMVEQAAPTAPGRVVDLGAGTGTGTIALARRFGAAEVVAVDNSAEMLQRIRAKADELGLSGRIRTVRADLDAGWPLDGPVDITWASMSLHHLADPDRVLGDVFAATRRGGLVAVAEMSEPVRFLPDDLGFGRPGLEARCLELVRGEHARRLPEIGADWPPRLAAAGFTGLGERRLTIDLRTPLPPGSARYASGWLRRLRAGVAAQLEPDDVDTLATLLDGDGPGSLRRRDDLHIHGTRTVTLARRP